MFFNRQGESAQVGERGSGREREAVGGRERISSRENLYSVQSPTWGVIPRPGDRDLIQNQELDTQPDLATQASIFSDFLNRGIKRHFFFLVMVFAIHSWGLILNHSVLCYSVPYRRDWWQELFAVGHPIPSGLKPGASLDLMLSVVVSIMSTVT